MIDYLLKHLPTVLKVLVAIALVLALRGYFQEREDRVRLDAELEASRQLLVKNQHELDAVTRGMAERERETRVMVKQIQELKARPASLREIVREIPQYIPFQQPPEIPPPSPDAPEAPPKLELDESQAQDLRKFYLDCRQATFELRACQENAEDWKRKETLWEERERILTEQRDAAVRAVKGGTFWTRLKRESKYAVGAAGGAGVGAGLCSQSQGAVIAACAGVGALTGFIITHF
jgi:hypothetical protein